MLKFPLIEGGEIYVYLLIEFQSTPERMGLRLLGYLLRIYEKQLKDHGRLFPVAPLVIYNGKKRWTKEPAFEKAFESVDESLAPYIPHFRYLLIDVVRLDEALLRELKSAVAYLFLIDKSDIRAKDHAIGRIIGILRELYGKDKELYTIIARYISGLYEWKGIEAVKLEEWIHEGGTSMLAESIDELKAENRREGKREGRREGRHEGKREAARKMLEKGYPVEEIAEITGLSVREIQGLKKGAE